MRSFFTTLILASLALVLGSLAVVQIKDRNLSSIFGAPPRETNETLFTFDVSSPVELTITNGAGDIAAFSKTSGLWFMDQPSKDRADFRHLQSLVFATRHLVIEEIIPADELDPIQSGLGGGSNEFAIKITASSGVVVADYILGQRTPWHRVAGENGELAETFYIQPNGDFDDGHVYVCAGANARVLLDAGFNILRDHRPFLFNAGQLADIRVQSKQGEVLLSRKDLKSPWRIAKPLDLRTDPDAIALLVKGLYDAQSPKIHDPGAITIPTRTTAGPFMEINLGFFDSKGTIRPGKVSLQVEPPASEDATFAYAKVTGRSTIFELPIRSTTGQPSLSDLPITINDLRSRTLTSLPPSSLKSITILTPDSPAPLILSLGKNPATNKVRWVVTRNGVDQPANESTVARFFTSLARDKVIGFPSDAPADLTPFGLNPPAKSVTLDYGDGAPTTIDFGRTAEDRFYAYRKDEGSVVEIDSGAFDRIETETSAWRDSLLWSMSAINLAGFTIERPNQAPLRLKYNFLTEQWSAQRDGKDISVLLNKQRANILLDSLENIRVTRWLGPNNEEATNRLFDPALTIEVAYYVYNDEGEKSIQLRLLNLTPRSFAVNNEFFYGRLSGDSDYFLLNKLTFDSLNVDLIEK